MSETLTIPTSASELEELLEEELELKLLGHYARLRKAAMDRRLTLAEVAAIVVSETP